MLRAFIPPVTILAALLTTAIAPAAETLIGGPQGVSFRGDSRTGGFQFFGTCGGPISSMAVLGGDMFLGSNGTIYRIGMDSGLVETSFPVPNNSAAMAVHDGALLIGGTNQTVLRVSPDGAVLATYSTIEAVEAIAVHGGLIYVSGGSSAIYRASVADGVFSYFTCSCFGPVNALVVNDEHLFLVDGFGSLWTIRTSDGQPLNAIFIESAGQAIGLDGADVVVANEQGQIRTLDPASGAQRSIVQAPIQVHAMLVQAGGTGCMGDLNNDGEVGVDDLSQLLGAFGTTTGGNLGGDLNDDQRTDLADLALLLSVYGTTCD